MVVESPVAVAGDSGYRDLEIDWAREIPVAGSVAFAWLGAGEQRVIGETFEYQVTYFVESKVLEKGCSCRVGMEDPEHLLACVWKKFLCVPRIGNWLSLLCVATHQHNIRDQQRVYMEVNVLQLDVP